MEHTREPESYQMSESSTASCPVVDMPLCVLLVDDDPVFRQGLAENLREDGHAVLEYGAADEIPVSAFEAVSVVVTDFELPGNDGLRLAEHAHAAQPCLPVVVVTARPDALVGINAAARSSVILVQKPVDYHRFHRLLQTLVADAAPTRRLS
jgi:DNA-binding NtrC family response regulator